MSNVTVDESQGKYQIDITPYQLQKKQGRDPMFMSIDFLDIDIDQYFAALTNQSIYYSEDITSNYPVESLKGDLDRNFKKQQFKRGVKISDGLEKYPNLYLVDLVENENVDVIIAVGFYPYKNGSIAKILVKPTRKAEKGVRSIDWVKIKSEISVLLSSAVN